MKIILADLRRHGPGDASALASRLGWQRLDVADTIAWLAARDLIESDPSFPDQFVYRVKEKGRKVA